MNALWLYLFVGNLISFPLAFLLMRGKLGPASYPLVIKIRSSSAAYGLAAYMIMILIWPVQVLALSADIFRGLRGKK